MSRRSRLMVLAASAVMLLAVGVLPFALMLLPHPEPVAAASPGAAGRGVYVGDGSGYHKLFPRATISERFPADAFATDAGAAVFVKSRQYDYLSAYAIYTFPAAAPVAVDATVSAGVLALRPKAPLERGRYVVKVSRDDAWGGDDYFFLTVSR